MTVSSIVLGSGSSPTDLIHVAYLGEGEDLLMVGVPGKLLFILSILYNLSVLSSLYFFTTFSIFSISSNLFILSVAYFLKLDSHDQQSHAVYFDQLSGFQSLLICQFLMFLCFSVIFSTNNMKKYL